MRGGVYGLCSKGEPGGLRFHSVVAASVPASGLGCDVFSSAAATALTPCVGLACRKELSRMSRAFSTRQHTHWYLFASVFSAWGRMRSGTCLSSLSFAPDCTTLCTTHSEISLALLGLLVLNQKLNIFAKSILTFPHFSPKKTQVRLALSRNGVGDRTGSSVDLNSGRLFRVMSDRC